MPVQPSVSPGHPRPSVDWRKATFSAQTLPGAMIGVVGVDQILTGFSRRQGDSINLGDIAVFTLASNVAPKFYYGDSHARVMGIGTYWTKWPGLVREFGDKYNERVLMAKIDKFIVDPRYYFTVPQGLSQNTHVADDTRGYISRRLHELWSAGLTTTDNRATQEILKMI